MILTWLNFCNDLSQRTLAIGETTRIPLVWWTKRSLQCLFWYHFSDLFLGPAQSLARVWRSRWSASKESLPTNMQKICCSANISWLSNFNKINQHLNKYVFYNSWLGVLGSRFCFLMFLFKSDSKNEFMLLVPELFGRNHY